MRSSRPLSASIAAVVLALALLATACSSTAPSLAHHHLSLPLPKSASRTSGTTSTGSHSDSHSSSLHWTGCGGAFQCASLTVPLDYAQPGGTKIKLALIRLPATDPSGVVGDLLVNPGGPGASGVQFLRQDPTLYSSTLRAHFNIVSFDPRGVGESDPVKCENGQALTNFINLNPAPTSLAGVRTMARASRQFAQSCLADSGKALLANVGTVDAARDMDRIRAALGDPKLTYLGFSYGTFLGATYASLFPTHVRAMVLDGALNPDEGGQALDLQQGKGFELDLRDFLDACRSQGCPLATEPGGVDASFTRILTRIRTGRPLPTDSGRTLYSGEGYLGIIAALYSRSTWNILGEALQEALHGNGTLLLALSDAYTERQPNGTYSNQEAANAAINCVDRPSITKLATYEQQAPIFEKAAPVFGELEDYSPLACAYWPVPPTDHPHPISAKGAPPIVVVGTTADPATPYAGAEALAHQLASGVLVTHVGVGHTAYGDSACVRAVVDAYFIHLTVPRRGTVCRS